MEKPEERMLTGALKPFFLVHDIRLLKVILAFAEIDNALNHANEHHDPTSERQRQKPSNNRDAQHNDARCVISQIKLMNTKAPEKNCKQTSNNVILGNWR